MEPHFTVTFCRTLVEKSRTGWTPLDCDCVAWRYGRSHTGFGRDVRNGVSDLQTYHRVRPLNSCHRKEIGDVQVIACMAVLATIWVTPWDNLMLFEGVWTYPPVGAVLLLWLLAPVAVFVGFIALTWFHWGQGDSWYAGAEPFGPSWWVTMISRGYTRLLERTRHGTALVHTTYACRGYDAWRTGPSP